MIKEKINVICKDENISCENINETSEQITELEEDNEELGLKLVGWEITRRCNLSCPHCYTAAATTNQAVPEFSTDECYKIIDDIARLGAEMIGFTGGEPLLRNDLENLIAYAKSLGIRSTLTTNGLLLNENRARSLKEAGLEAIQVSIDGSNPYRNAKIRKCLESDFEVIVNNIRSCQKLKIPVNLAMLLCSETLDDAAPYLDFADELGIKIVRFCGFVPVGRGKKCDISERFLFTNSDLDELREFIDYATDRETPKVLFDPAFGSIPPYHCFHTCIAGTVQFYLDTLGNVYPCTSMLNSQFLVGNIHDRSLEDIYKDDRMRPTHNFSESSLKGSCAACEHLSDCHGACRGITLAHTGDVHASFPYCLKQHS